MKFSVLIPTYNSSKTIEQTLDSVFNQSYQPSEILVMDDGSTDHTVSILDSLGERIKVFQQKNRGVASARNALCALAKGDVFAFLDHDDIWNPRYLEMQQRSCEEHPDAVAFFTAHLNFHGYANYHWQGTTGVNSGQIELIQPEDFLLRYNLSNGTFYTMSVCCVPRRLTAMTGKPLFWESVSGVDDCYMGNRLPLHGPVAYSPIPLVAYRVTNEAQSVNHLSNFQKVIEIFGELEKLYVDSGSSVLIHNFQLAFSSKRRTLAKILMGTSRTAEARNHLRRSLNPRLGLATNLKSILLLMATYLPKRIQPRWPSSTRHLPARDGRLV